MARGAVLCMMAALALRIVSGFPDIETSHSHGGLFHTHEAGGIVHEHHGEDNLHDHSHQDNPGQVLSHAAFWARLGIAHTPEDSKEKAASEPSTRSGSTGPPVQPDAPAPDSDEDDPHYTTYFSAATAVLLAQAAVCLAPTTTSRRSKLRDVLPMRAEVPVGPRTTRGPPRPVSLQEA